MAQRTCETDGCENLHHAKGMCKPCYRRDYYHRNRNQALEYCKAYWAENRAEITARTKARQKANPEARRKTVRKYKAANPDKVSAAAERFRLRHPDRVAAWGAEWYRANREYARKLQAALRASKLQDPAWLAYERQRTREKQSRRRAQIHATRIAPVDLAIIIERDGMVCHLCREDIASLDDLHFDHVVPLARGGEHSMANIKAAHVACNLRKGSRLLSELDWLPVS